MAAQVQQDIVPSDSSANPGSSDSFKPVSNSNPNLNLKRIYIVLGVIFVGVLVGLLFLLFSQKIIKNPAELKTPSINFEDINFPSNVWKNRIIGNVSAAAAEENKEKRFEFYSQVFTDMVAIYTRDHEAKTRIQTETLAKFIAEEFTDLYNPQNFQVSCLDPACGMANFPTEIEEIRDELRNIAALEQLVVESILKKLEAAAFSNDQNYQWQNYFNAFQEIKTEKRRTGDKDLEQIGLRLQQFLKENYQENYDLIKGVAPELLQI